MLPEGVIKYQLNHHKTGPLGPYHYSAMLGLREELILDGFLGVGSDGVPYGNLSRLWTRAFGEPIFIITATGSSQYRKTDGNHYCMVVNCDLNSFSIDSVGPAPPSSEAHTHYVLYKNLPDVTVVAHIHNLDLWNRLKGKVADTGESPYGSRELAEKITRMANHNELEPDRGILRLSGHTGGLFFYGKNESIILELIRSLNSK